MKIGVLHPGMMGASVAETLRASGHDVYWASEGRSAATRERANGLFEVGTLEDLVAEVDHLLSVCPPDAALPLAGEVSSLGFRGIYVDANAISPGTARAIASRFKENYVDGGVIGPPARKPGTTRLYLSGEQSERVAGWFRKGPLEAIAIGREASRASALKMCYAAYTKGVSALLLDVRALAEREGVAEALLSEWALSQPGLEARAEATAMATASKAWRFEGEMLEIARTFREADLPGDFHLGAAEVYRRMARLEGNVGSVLSDVLAALLEKTDREVDDTDSM